MENALIIRSNISERFEDNYGHNSSQYSTSTILWLRKQIAFSIANTQKQSWQYFAEAF